MSAAVSSPPPPSAEPKQYEQHTQLASGKKLIVYHTNWACYARNFQVKDIPIQYISDINYAFFDLKPSAVPPHHLVPTITDPWADHDKRFTGPSEGVSPPDSWDEHADGPWGNFGQLLKLKKLGMRFNVGLSIGGWTMSQRFSDAVRGDPERDGFVKGILALLDRFPGVFNRIDIDWEYISPIGSNHGAPENLVRAEDGENFIKFLILLRRALDSTGRSQYEISACVTGDPQKMSALPAAQMAQVLDTVNIMTYDFASSAWHPCATAHHTNLLSTPYSPLSVARAVEAYIAAGVPPGKIVIGAAMYSRGFANTSGLGHPASGVVEDKSWEDGVCDYKSLPRCGAVEYWDEQAQASYSYDAARRILNSYDTPQSIRAKCRYVWEMGLKGIIVWESSGDVPVTSDRSLIRALWEGLSQDCR
ncbi:glycoside hydrolase [Powellomyces hirtus]|nr:glycoside hydrolase [Powellomyces hirtus]